MRPGNRNGLALLLCGAALTGCATRTELPHPLGRDDAAAREAVNGYVERGEAALPELADLARCDDPLVRHRAKTAIGRITGQWGTTSAIRWKRSVAEAANEGKPLLVLHLFGKFDEEFC